MAELDGQILQWFNQYAQTIPLFDSIVVLITRLDLLRGVVIVFLLWWAWMGTSTRLITDNLKLVRIVIGVVLAIAVARGLQNMLPHRVRPAHDPELGLQLPLTGTDTLQDWSSFPSDHAVLMLALVVAVLSLNRLIGLLALIWAICVVLLPRIYLGLHYPSDIVAGAVLGAAIMVAMLCVPLPAGVAPLLARLEDRYRGLAYAGFFVFSYLCASMFDDVRELLRALERFAEIVLS